jgi:glucose/arabinose dehydrogenase
MNNHSLLPIPDNSIDLLLNECYNGTCRSQFYFTKTHTKKMMPSSSIIVASIILLVVAIVTANNDDLPLYKLKFREAGYRINVVGRVKDARQLSLTDDESILFVGTTDDSAYALKLKNNGDGQIVQDGDAIPVVTDLKWPNGVAVDNTTGDLYVAEIPNVWKIPSAVQSIKNGEKPRPPQLVRKFPTEEWHGWKYIRLHKNRLYMPIGSPCNTCLKDLPYGTITSFIYNTTDPSSQDFRYESRGVRNTVGFDWHPRTGDLWFTENGRDEWGNDRPGDELNRIRPGGNDHFGFPYCYEKDLVDPEYNKQGNCDAFVPAEYVLGPHVAALGIRFYRGSQFPQQYRTNYVAFIAEHGSWNREVPLGYRIMTVNTTESSSSAYKVFLEGWLNLPSNAGPMKDSDDAWGRPVDIVEMRDGSLLVSDDKAGAIYRITYNPTNH